MHSFPRFPRIFPAPLLCTLLLVAGLGAGCSSRYIITTNTGSKIITASKPKLVESNYVYRDATGEKVRLSSMRVRQIEPYSKAAAGVPLRKPDLK